MLSANSYMFRHQDTILRGFNNNKWSQVQRVLQVLVALTIIIRIKNYMSQNVEFLYDMS